MRPRIIIPAAVLAGVILIAVLLMQTSLTIDSPTSAGSYCNPVQVQISWSGVIDPQSFKATMNGNDVTANFMPLPSSSPAKATIPGKAGQNTFSASAAVLPKIRSILSLLHKDPTPQTASISFDADTALSFSPSTLSLATNSTGSANVIRTCANLATAGALPVSLNTDAAPVADAAQTPVTIPALSGQVSASLKTGPRLGTANIQALTAGAKRATLAVTTAKRATGCFTAVTPTFTQMGGTMNSPDGTFATAIRSQPNTNPPPPTYYFAQFKKGNQKVGSEVQFATDSAGGGAGFCPNSNLGVVLSGYGGKLGQASDYFYTLVDLLGTNPPLREFPVWSKSTVDPGVLYGPVLQLSADCTLALVAGANPQGKLTQPSQQDTLQVVDAITGKNFPNNQLYFHANTLNSINACLVDAGANQKVNISVDNVPLGSVTIQ